MEHIKTKKLIDTCKNAGNILDLSNCKITYADCEIIAKHFKGTTLDLSQNKIGDKGAAALSKWPGTTLDLSQNKIGDKGAAALSKWSGTTLDLSENEIEDEGAEELSKWPGTTLNLFETNIRVLTAITFFILLVLLKINI